MKGRQTPFNILVVDDNPKNIQVIGTFLKDAKYDVGFAMSGREALDMLSDSVDYHLVLMDIRMPDMDGFEACAIMKKDPRLAEIPVIFLSALQETDNIVAAFDSGGVDYITKPFNAKELLARVNTHLLLKERTRQVTVYARELERLNATKDKFFSIIAHDLRNPVEGITMISRLLRNNLEKYSEEDIRKHVELIISASESGQKLLENLMLWSRTQTGSLSFNPAKFDLDASVQKIIGYVEAQAASKKITVVYKTKHIQLTSDESMLGHVLRNILSNAVKFTPAGGSVTILTGKSKGTVTISVVDTGIGISDSDRSKLFRVDGKIASRPGTANETGTGLGMILSKEFLDRMGGTIHVESSPGKGSRFEVTIPLE